MVNLSECKFGDKLKTRNGCMALFLQRSNVIKYAFSCAIESGTVIYVPLYYIHGKRCFHSEHEHTDLDIIGKWEDEIEKPTTTYEIKPDMPKAIKPINGVSEAMVEQWLQDIKHLK